ncbi:hypothetical protein QZH41_000315 [Actinostola sp. cb2023]|nr:hypothetical protein QZH41_000315 [Actinostola sp. cb2023]
MVSDTTHIVRNSIGLLRTGVANRLECAGIGFDAVPGMEDLFNDNPVNNPFAGLQGKRQQMNYFRENFGLVVNKKKLGQLSTTNFCREKIQT